jgi:Tripartite tricarboxylate transporter family receptor
MMPQTCVGRNQDNLGLKSRLSQRQPVRHTVSTGYPPEITSGEGTVTTKRGFLLALAASASISAIRPTFAEIYPARPITIIVPFPAGGPTDAVGRMLAERMRASLGKPLTIENVAGAGGSIGVGRVARALPDGYTIVLGIWSTHVVNAAIYALQYDVAKDFEPIALLANTAQLFLAKKTMPANDLTGLIAWLRANPDKSRNSRSGQPTAYRWGSFSTYHRYSISVRALSRRRPVDAGFGRRADRS